MSGRSVTKALGARQQKRVFAQLAHSPCGIEQLQLTKAYGLGGDQQHKHSRLFSPAAVAARGADKASKAPPLLPCTRCQEPHCRLQSFASPPSHSDQNEEDSISMQSAATPALCGSSCGSAQEDDAFPEFVATSIVDPLLPAFLFHLGSTPVLAALTQLEQWDLHPVGAHDFGSLAVTIAGMLVLCRRAAVTPGELTPELLLTLLWLLENAHGSQYRPLKFCLPSYLRLHPDNATHREELAEHYKRAMVALQLQVLQRCDWRVLLLHGGELDAALDDLDAHSCFDDLCTFVEACAEANRPVLGSHGHSPDMARAAARASAHGRSTQAEARCRSSTDRSGQTGGLDGCYWELPADKGTGAGQGRQRRSVLAPRNA